MTKTYEAVIIGAGIIGSAIGCGLARRGWRTLNIDRHSTSGQGSTSSSVAIVRTHYSTLEGSALAWEGTHCCLLYTSPSPRDGLLSRMPSSA